MMKTNKKRILRAALAAICTVTIASTGFSVYAEPSSKDLEQKTSDLEGQLDDLNGELASLSKELDNTSKEIETLSEDVEQAKLDLAAAKLNEESQYDSMKDRIKFMYEGGSASLLEILFSSENMADFLNKAEYVSNISSYDREMLEEFEQIRVDVEKKQKDLESKQDELKDLQSSLSEQKSALSSRISSTSAELSDYKSQLARAKEAEQAAATAQDNSVSGSTASDKSSGGGSSNGGSSGGGSSTTNSGSSIAASASDVALLAAVLECEAGASYDGMLAVGTVIMNRVESSRFPNTIKEVIFQPGQFYPATSGKLNSVLSRGPAASAYSAAKAVLGGTRYAAVADCYFFHAAWTGKDGVNVGGNVFW